MAIAEQFAGLSMDQLIGGPLSAAADASNQLACSTAEFINRVGFDANGKVRTVAFGYQKRSANNDGTSNLDEMKVDVPMLAIVPIPNLQVDEVNILFDMEVKQSERSESTSDMNASVNTSLNFGVVKVSVTGNVSSHQSNTRSTDNSAKYHVDVRATNHGTPEGLARVLDMIAASVSPALVESTLKDGNGQDLSQAAKEKAERLKALRHSISELESRVNAARDNLQSSIAMMKKIGSAQLNVFQGKITGLINGLNKDAEGYEGTVDEYNSVIDEINRSWSVFQGQAGDFIRLIADSNDSDDGTSLSAVFGLKELDQDAEQKYVVKVYAAPIEKRDDKPAENSFSNQYSGMVTAQNKAVESQKRLDAVEKELSDAKAEYSSLLAGQTVIEKKEEE
ncbi:MAG: DUF2589 domain-containing protein [Lachnospiraceae bacterium]|nr:DUF2589 domain-containing protein [Lachnospiraceae bacterium]